LLLEQLKKAAKDKFTSVLKQAPKPEKTLKINKEKVDALMLINSFK